MDYNKNIGTTSIGTTSIPPTFSFTDFTIDYTNYTTNAINYYNNCTTTVTPERFIIKCNLPY